MRYSNDPSTIAAAMIAGPFVLAGIVAAFIGAVALRGFVLAVLWNWFIENTFTAPHLSVGDAVGVSILWTAFTGAIMREKTTGASVFLSPLLMLGFAAIAHFIFGVG